MKRMSVVRITLLVALLGGVVWSFASAQSLTVPPGFDISVFATGVRGVRTLKVGPDGMLYAVQSRDGRVVRLDPNSEGDAETVVDRLNRPYGLAFHEGWMYVGERQVGNLGGSTAGRIK